MIIGLEYTLYIVAGVLLFLLLKKFGKRRDTKIPPGKLPVPRVAGGLPLIGHALQIYWNPLQFIKGCAKEYGSAFVINLFQRRIMLICDNSTASHMLKKPEDEFSLEESLMDLVGADYKFLPAAQVFKKSLRIKCDEILPLIQGEIDSMMRLLLMTNQKSFLFRNFMKKITRCMAGIHYLCFMGKTYTDQNWDEMQKLIRWIKILAVPHFFLPKLVFEWIFRGTEKRSRRAILAYTQKLLQEYRDDHTKLDSKLIAEEDVLTDTSIGCAIVLFCVHSGETYHLSIFEAINHLARQENAGFLKELRDECKANAGLGLEQLVNGPLLNACIMESARLGSTLIASVRKPKKEGLTIGNYFIDNDIDYVGLSTPMLMETGEVASVIFKNPDKFNPYRFIGDKKESFKSRDVVAWGSGTHLCPAKRLSIYATKLFLASFVDKFNFEVDEKKLNKEISYQKYLDIFVTKRND